MLINIPGTKLVRDTRSMALLNTDIAEKNEYLTKVRLLKTQKDEINTMKNHINGIQQDIGNIKELIQSLISQIKEKN